MRRSALLLVLAAACGPKSPPDSAANTGGAPGDSLAVAAGGATAEWTATLVPANGSRFPALSVDGTTIVDLVLDAEDFTDRPIATVAFWTRAGRVDADTLVSGDLGGGVTADEVTRVQEVVATANAKLAATRWLPLSRVEATGEDPQTGAASTLELGDGLTITLAQVAHRFPAPGTLDASLGGGGCGEVLGLSHGYGSREGGFVVVYPRVSLDGDSCTGTSRVELAIVVPAR